MINNHIPAAATHTHQHGLRNRLQSDHKSKITINPSSAVIT
jgi:hypothetical protein